MDQDQQRDHLDEAANRAEMEQPDCDHPWHSASTPDGEPVEPSCPECGDQAYPHADTTDQQVGMAALARAVAVAARAGADVEQSPTLAALWVASKYVGDHPDLPVVDRIEMKRHLHGPARRLGLVGLAHRYGVQMHRSDRSAWIVLPIAHPDANGIEIAYVISTHLDDAPGV